ncbi:hypothetical protein B0T22DRAFT_182794 [Podospora appendiculata]|uniref:Chitin synthase regulatory factor n=1 Tax=Podospora appendiculata TaxID=314037 RepID=A0AAE0XCS2_9PEZI|nr:hypothetical protein B0T22DRAFT_182794 [Podospora appendiculata]
MPRLGATFVPGGYDDFYMPEVIAPAPQRVMPEVPHNMQQDLQRMELEAHDSDPRRRGNSAVLSPTNDRYSQNRSGQEDEQHFKPFHKSSNSLSTMEAPSFSPFPKVKGENIPPSDEEKEEILWQARNLVLHSNNVSMQVTWARDALIWIEVAAEAHAREWKREGNGRERPATPKTEHDLRVDAVNIIDYLAGQDHPEANYMKGKWLEFGKFGFRENKREAYTYYRKAADNGCGRAEYRMGMLYENSNDIPNAIRHYTEGVKLKDTASNYRLGMMHLMGQHGHQKDILLGLDMIQTAADTADEDSPQGAYVYGLLIARELPDITIPETLLPFELPVARQYIEKAAYLGMAKAQQKMGQAYELSQLGCDFNPAYSLHYYGLAARHGQPEAALGVSRWFLFGFEGYFPKNEQLAFKYAQDAANASLATGEFAMGYYYEIGIHVPKDVREARRWYELAADHGNKDAVGRLESISQSKTLTKKDHETTTLTRIKSQHGSQRGKRPDRFTRPADVLPTLSESGGNSPVDQGPPVPQRASPPQHRPTIVEDHIEFPDPSRHNTMTRPPAFTVNLDASNLAMRPKSTAPYPEEDDRPSPLNLNIRSKSTAPYPEDDTFDRRPPLLPHYHPGIRPSSSVGPQADRPMSAFGIRPLSGGGPQNMQQDAGPRGRLMPQHSTPAGWEPQVPGGYRQPSPGPARQDNRQDSAYWQSQHNQAPQPPPQRLAGASIGPGATVPAGSAPVGDPTRTRLQKQNPNVNNMSMKPPPGQFPPAGSYNPQPNVPGSPAGQPGRDYGPRIAARPTNDGYDRYGAGPPPANSRLPAAASNGTLRPDRHDSIQSSGPPPLPGHARPPSQGGPAQMQARLPPQAAPAQIQAQPQRKPIASLNDGGGRNSAPPPSAGRPGTSPGPSAVGSPAPSVASTTKLPGHGGPVRPGPGGKVPSEHPDGKTMGQGPATFEEMGIPQGKNDSDCVVM